MFYSRSKNRHKHWYHRLSIGHKKLWALGVVCAFLLVAALVFLVVYALRAASYDITLVGKNMSVNMLYDSQRRPMAALADHESPPVQWDELPEHLVQAFVAREDSHFFDHGGVVYSSFVRSLLRNLTSMRYKQGGSTITMQLTRHVFELQGKTLDRKLLEIALTQRVENNYSKKDILCQYLSRIYFGQSCYGLREAASYYFGKAVKDLSLEESATLAGLVRAPSLYNPVRNKEQARKVRNETLQRMLELQMISPDAFEQACAAPIEQAARSTAQLPELACSYPTLWANAEMESLPDVQEELGQGLSVVSYLVPEIQQYTEQAVQQALNVVESSAAPLPEAWKPQNDPAAAEAIVRMFDAAKRPAWLKQATPGNEPLQCCVLVVDSRLNKRGNILAVMSARNPEDRRDLWQGTVEPGRVAAPLIFCCACMPGGHAHHIVAKSAQVTGSRLGYHVVHSFLNSLGISNALPDASREEDLYNGLFPVRRMDLARVLFDLQNMGKGYKLTLISSVWSQGQRLLYAHEPEKAPEYIRRESAVAVSHLPPFIFREGEPLVLHEELPNDGGQWCMVFNDKGVGVFVWMGLEKAKSPTPPELRRLISQATLLLARELHTYARQTLRSANQTPTTP